MNEPIEFLVEDDMGVQRYTIVDNDSPIQEMPESDRESMGVGDIATAQLQQIHATIRAYTRYALGAFRQLGDAEVKEITLKFGLKIAGEGGLPILAKASTEGCFNIEVTCAFPQEGDSTAKRDSKT
jgi:hypothetical protein